MPDTGENNGGGSGGNSDITGIASEMLGTSANPSFAAAILDYEIAKGVPLAAGVAAAVAWADLPVAVGVAAASGVGWAVDKFVGLAQDFINGINAELGTQADIMAAVNLDGRGLDVPDPVTGMGYF